MSRFAIPNIKHFKLTALLLLSPFCFFAQSLTGLWTGSLSNDSNTIRKDQSFEIALTEYRGRVYGYSRSEFIVNDTLYYILKRVKGTIDGDICEVTDDEIVSYNFRGKLDKGIRVTSTFRRNLSDSTWYLDGTWKTNATRKYYSVTGKLGLEEEKDLAASKLFPHLEELNLANDVAFYRERKEAPVIVKVAHPEKIKTEYYDRPRPDRLDNDMALIAPVKPGLQKPAAVPVSLPESDELVKTEPEDQLHADKEMVADVSKNENRKIPDATVTRLPAPPSNKISETKKTEIVTAAEKPVSLVSSTPVAEKKDAYPVSPVKQDKSVLPANNPGKKEQVIVKTQPVTAKQPDEMIKKQDAGSIAVSNPVPEKKETAPVITEAKKTLPEITAGAAVIEGRKTVFNQVVNFRSDSLALSLYDNGEIDGDTVSVFFNGEVLLSKQGLKASAIKKTIYITPGREDFTLVLFAENLGKYPPNTGLLVVHDGDDVYNLLFSSDLQKSAGIVFRRNK